MLSWRSDRFVRTRHDGHGVTGKWCQNKDVCHLLTKATDAPNFSPSVYCYVVSLLCPWQPTAGYTTVRFMCKWLNLLQCSHIYTLTPAVCVSCDNNTNTERYKHTGTYKAAASPFTPAMLRAGWSGVRIPAGGKWVFSFQKRPNWLLDRYRG